MPSNRQVQINQAELSSSKHKLPLRRSLFASILTHLFVFIFFAVFILIGRKPADEKLSVQVIEKPLENVVPKTPESTPRALTQNQPKKAILKLQSKPRAVFGVTKTTLTDSTSEIVSKQGNTVAKEFDREKLRPEDEDALPIPVDEIEVTRMPVIDRVIRIPYPEGPKSRGIQGAIRLRILTDQEGKVRDAEIAKSLDPELDSAVMAVVKQFLFKPAMSGSHPVAVWFDFNYNFVIE